MRAGSPLRTVLLGWWCLCGWGAIAAFAADAVTPAQEKFFRERIEPVLVEHCYECHSGRTREPGGALRLDSRGALERGGDSGPALRRGDSAGSLLLQALRHEQGLEMPPDKPRLSDAVIADFEQWVRDGAADPRTAPATDSATSARDDEARQHWSFQRVRKPPLPSVRESAWPRTPVDHFVLQALETRGWTPSPAATRQEWLRRVTWDLTGLPPEPAEIEEFLADPSPAAEERVVDRLLASPHYGERFAQHWLDVVRYAETEGYEYDRPVPDAWRYRDYVIRSLNADKPYDQFLTEQLAGDELQPNNHEYLIASIFHRLGPVRRNAGNPEVAFSRNEVLTERTDILGAAFLGLTVGCARCHHHKLEPISQRDYYSLQAYLAATDEHNLPLAPPDEHRRWQEQTKAMQAQVQELRKKAKDASEAEKARLLQEAKGIEERIPSHLPTIPATHNNMSSRTPIHVLRRGVWEQKGDQVGPRPLGILVSASEPELPPEVADPRTRLARWIASADHPLTARVIVNRLWQYHFGQGLVKTVNDLGLRGERPSHPELLDWLAATLVEQHWQWKPIHRMLVLSNTYRQSSHVARSEEYVRSDPENRWLWKFSRRRLSAEELRDGMLAVAGRLNRRMEGTSVMIPVDSELVNLLYAPSQWKVTPDRSDHDRRAIYLAAKRNLRLPLLEAFDAPALLTSCGRREVSTHAPQALELLNGPAANDLSRAFAARLRQEAKEQSEARHPLPVVERAYWLALGRSPSAEERSIAEKFVAEHPLEEFALAIFNLNDFLYVP